MLFSMNKHSVLIINRSILFFPLGMLAGYLWLSPVFCLPGSPALHEAGFQLSRILRIMSVLMIFPLIIRRVMLLPFRGHFQRNLFWLVVWTFIFSSAFSIINYPNPRFIVGSVGPYMVAGLSLICLCVLNTDEFKSWFSGIGLMAIAFFCVGLWEYGLETTKYYGISRAHLGFIHPTQSASVVFLSSLFVMTLIEKAFRYRIWAKQILLACITVGTAFLLFKVASRNALLLLLLIIFSSAYYRLFRQSGFRFLGVIMISSIMLAVYGFAMWGDSGSTSWAAMDVFSSGRLSTFRLLGNNIGQENLISLFFGPTVFSQEFNLSTGFASGESVYTSLLNNYGLITLFSFLGFLLFVGRRLSKSNHALAFGIWCAIVVFMGIDAQGITPSNLGVFLLMAYGLRCAMLKHKLALSAR